MQTHNESWTQRDLQRSAILVLPSIKTLIYHSKVRGRKN